MKEKLREEMRRIVRGKNPEELLSTIKERASDPGVKIEFGKGKPPAIGDDENRRKEKKLLAIRDVIEVTHPIIDALLDYGNITRYLNSNSEIRDILEQIVMLKDASDRSSLESLMHLVNKLIDDVRDVVIDYTLEKRVLEASGDLRPIVMPASEGRNEIPNIYLRDESYDEEDRVMLAHKFLSSIPVGRSISIFFEGDFHEYLRSLLRRKLDKVSLSSEDIGSSRWELSQPYVTLARLLVWLRDNLWEDMLRDNVIELMKASSGVIYFGSSVQVFPQLSKFVEIWLEKEKNKIILKEMLDSIRNFSNKSHDIGRKAVEGEIELLYDKLNYLTMRLIEGSLEWESLRRVVDSMLDIVETLRKQGQEVKANLRFVSRLLGADVRGSPSPITQSS